MSKLLKILLIILLSVDDCFLEILDERNTFKDISDYDLQEKDYQSFSTKSKNIGAHENEYRKLGLLGDNVNSEHKSSYTAPRSKFRIRHSRNGKNGRKRRVQDMEGRIFEYPEPRNILKNTIETTKHAEEVSELYKNSPAKKHITAKRWPLRRMRKFHGPRFAKSDYQQAVSEDDSCDYDDAHFEHKGSEISKLGSYILGPEQNELVVLRNLNLTKQEKNDFDNAELTDQNLVVNIKSLDFDSISKENSTNEDSTCNSMSEPESEKSDGDGDDEYELSKGAESDENLKQKVKEEILNCTTAGLEKYLKLFGKTHEKGAGSTGGNNDCSAPEKSDLMHLNITIHGLVMNNDKPSKIHGNGTIKVKPTADEERLRRAIKVPFFQKRSRQQDNEEDETEEADDEAEKPDSKKECNQTKEPKESTESKEPKESKESKESKEYKEPKECKENTQKEEPKCEDISNPDAGLTPDKLSNEIVKMVSHMVRSNPKMKTLWPSLRRNRPSNKGAACNLRTTANCSSRKQIENMLRKAMASVNDIIEKEVQSRSCVPLSEDLAEFYEVILEMHAKQAKRKEEREEMLIQAEKLDKESTESEDKPKGKHCKSKSKRESQFDDLEDENDELYDLMHLRRLQYDREITEERRRREAQKRTHELILDTANSSLVRKLREMYSPAFLKLNSVMESLQRSEVGQEQL